MPLTELQFVILGIIQGITEWLPISSSGILSLVMANFFNITNLHDLITTALFFHLGTFLAALIYFRKEVWRQIQTLFNYKSSKKQDKNVLKFLIISTIISGVLGYLLTIFIFSLEGINLTGKIISFAIGILLLITAIIQFASKKKGLKKAINLKTNDGIFLGFVQAISVLPGISRSGITMSSLMLKKFKTTTALKLSFLMSLPIVLVGNIILNLEDLIFTPLALYGLLSSFVFGLFTINILMKVSKRINFAWFVLFFAILMMVSVLF